MYMMEGIDGTYDAAVYVGYHARAGTPNGVLDHTSSGDVTGSVMMKNAAIIIYGASGATCRAPGA